MPVFFRQAWDSSIVLRALGGLLIVEEIVIYFVALLPLSFWYRASWRRLLACILYAIGAIMIVDALWIGARIAMAAFPTTLTTPYLTTCIMLSGYSCRENIILMHLQQASKVVAMIELAWCALLILVLLGRRWTPPLLPSAVAVGIATLGIAFFGGYLALPILWLHGKLVLLHR
jgi:glucose-6-phosphate-specific signal transduction histidine kinase